MTELRVLLAVPESSKAITRVGIDMNDSIRTETFSIPDGHVSIVTGGNTGLGFEAASRLVELGSQVVVAGRDAKRVAHAVDGLNALGGLGEAVAGSLDLASLESVGDFASWFTGISPRLDLLLNNAGVMAPPPSTTNEGFELQFGVNFVGHFALTGQLIAALERTAGARVVTMSSIGHRGASIDFQNLCLEKPYDMWREYGQSKLADLIFARELHSRLRASRSTVSSLAAHPGVSQSELVRHLPGESPAGVEFMPTEQGIRPALVAALSQTAVSGQYWGPDGPDETKGDPALAAIDPAAQDADLNSRLWEWTQEATGVIYP